MTKKFTALALAMALPMVAASGADAETYVGGPPIVFEGISPGQILLDPAVASSTPPIAAQGNVDAVWEDDPFNPLPFSEPISRTRIEVFVTDDMTECPRIWTALDCPVVVRADGTREGMVIGNYTHTGAGTVRVERIEYPSSVLVTDAWPLYFIAVGE